MPRDPLAPTLKRLFQRRIASTGAGLQLFVDTWPLLVGDHVGGSSTPIELREETLVVAVSSSVWLSEMTLRREELLRKIQGWVPEGVSELEFRLVPTRSGQSRATPSFPAPSVGQLSEADEEILATVEDEDLRDLLGRVRKLARGRQKP